MLETGLVLETLEQALWSGTEIEDQALHSTRLRIGNVTCNT